VLEENEILLWGQMLWTGLATDLLLYDMVQYHTVLLQYNTIPISRREFDGFF
jgi:hypothetical protein